jgi:hypothetical protein
MILRFLHWLAFLLRRVRSTYKFQHGATSHGKKHAPVRPTLKPNAAPTLSHRHELPHEQIQSDSALNNSQLRPVEPDPGSEVHASNPVEFTSTPEQQKLQSTLEHSTSVEQQEENSALMSAIEGVPDNLEIGQKNEDAGAAPVVGQIKDDNVNAPVPEVIVSFPVALISADTLENKPSPDHAFPVIQAERIQNVGRTVPPEKRRGGFSRGNTHGGNSAEQIERKSSFRPKPEIVCWKRGHEWVVAVDVSDSVSASGIGWVRQCGIDLKEDERKARNYVLHTLDADVEVQFLDSAQPVRISLPEAGPLLFELTGDGRKRGRMVKSISARPSAAYLAIVPHSWSRNERIAGDAHTYPEPVFQQEYLAHYFIKNVDEPFLIAFYNSAKETVIIGSDGPQFYLVGREVRDASDDMGPLFCGEPPRIAIQNAAWSDVGTIVIGALDQDQGWQKGFKPDLNVAEQLLPSEVLERKVGAYFLRFYDHEDTKIYTLNFRFVAGLQGILHPNVSFFPTENGHLPQTFEIQHNAGYQVSPVGEDFDTFGVQCTDDKTTFTIPPRPDCDHTEWLLYHVGNPAQRVNLSILLERLWWAVSEENNPPHDWQDKPIALRYSDLRASSTKALWLRFPKGFSQKNVSVGFSNYKSRSYAIRQNDAFPYLVVPTRDFCGYEEVEQPGEVPLFLQLASHSDTPLRIANVTTEIQCKDCERRFPTLDILVDHCVREHIDEYIKPLSYEQMRHDLPDLPHKIYKCSYCGYIVGADNSRDPESTIYNHVSRDCTKAPLIEAKKRVKFRVVEDVDEIRSDFIKTLPYIYLCNFCGERIRVEVDPATPSPSPEEIRLRQRQHVLSKHLDRLYKLV